MLKNVKDEEVNSLLVDVESYWIDFLNSGRLVEAGNKELQELYRRSLLVFKLMSDESSGGLLAAPEVDENLTKCGRYAYCWGRDAAFITSALDKAGYSDLVTKFYYWAINSQFDNGSWQQRYHMDGNLAPSWGFQIDETGTLIWGMLRHYDLTKDKEFLEKMWDSVDKAANFMVDFIDPENDLPKASYDLWEERIGQHTYSAAAVCAGLKAAVDIGVILDKQYNRISKWDETAIRIENSIRDNLWDSDKEVFLRSLNSAVEGWGFEGHGGKREIVMNPFGYKKWVSAKDIMIDISILGISVPFNIIKCDDYKVKKTADKIEEILTEHPIGGLRRYETDGYMGGNPWILTTLWMALYHIKCSNYDKATEYLSWVSRHRTYLGLLPEQVDKHTGEPAWVIPLTWSHAMFVIVYLELAERGRI
jgi:oligosaccharide amylase